MEVQDYPNAAALSGAETVVGLQGGNVVLIGVGAIGASAASTALAAAEAAQASANTANTGVATAEGGIAALNTEVGEIITALAPSTHVQTVGASDTVDIPGGPYRVLYVGTTSGGNDAVVTVMAQDGSTGAVVVGQGEAIEGILIRRVMVTGTDAGVADMVAW